MTTRNQVLTKAASYLGYVERPSNITQFWERQQPSYQGQPWCAAFVVDVLEQCGNVQLKAAASPYYCPSLEAWARKNGRWVNSRDAQPGDVLIFGTGIGVHTGFLERQRGDSVQTLEGNTSSGNSGSQNDGGGVYRRVRPRSWVRGAIRLDLNGSASPARKPSALDVTGTLDSRTVSALQAELNRARRQVRYWPTLDVDGDWPLPGPSQTGRAFQAYCGLPETAVDGVIGPQSVAAAEARYACSPSGSASLGRTVVRAIQRDLNSRIGA